MTGEDLYFWGVYRKKLKEIEELDKKLVCTKCGSKNIRKVTVQEPVFVKIDIPFKCNDCGYQGKPKVINPNEKK
jgi:hypothetical protein